MAKPSKKVAIGMSGGVDSTMAAFLLKKKGYDVVGLTMQIWGGNHSVTDPAKSGCYGPGEAHNIAAAQKAAKMLGVPHYVVDLRKEYQQSVLDYFRSEYERGKTPNPCIMCNSKIKFGLLLDKAFSSDIKFDYFATGHYARVALDKKTNRYLLKRGKDSKKDQSYFLYKLTQKQLSKIIFPLGTKKKDDVKKLARENGFTEFSEKPESQNFAECNDYYDLLPIGKHGQVVDPLGHVLGQHEGISHYTIGQRKNLKIGGLKEPYYVLGINTRKNVIIAGPREFAYSNTANVKNINWIYLPEPLPKNIKAKLRYGSPLVPCVVEVQGKNKAILTFSKPQFAVTPGQSAVFYKDDIVLGGGVISK